MANPEEPQSPLAPAPCKSSSGSASGAASSKQDDDRDRGGHRPEYFTSVGPNDVIFGRGSVVNDNPGNVAFRRIVHSRQADYVAAATRKDKQRVAQEVVQHVRFKVDPPGRFLRRVDPAAAREGGFDDRRDVWCDVGDAMALEKAKQALRRQSRDEADGSNAHGGAAVSPGPPAVAPDLAAGEPQTGGVAEEVGMQIDENEDGTPALSQEDGAAPVARAPGIMPIADAFLSAAHIMGNQNSSTSTTSRPTTMPGPGGGPALVGIMERAEANRKESERRPRDEKSRLLESVRLASELVKTIREEGRVALTNYRIRFGLVGGPDSSGDVIGSELALLGSILYHHLAGADPFNGSKSMQEGGGEEPEPSDDDALLDETSVVAGGGATQQKKKERRPNPRDYAPLRDLGFPVSLSVLVSSLLDSRKGTGNCYRTIGEVEEDLLLMIANPDKYLFDADEDQLRGQLDFVPGKLYGREQDISRLMTVFDRVTGWRGGVSTPPLCEMVLISGYSGIGKSVLVHQLRRPLAERNGHFISAKFDELGQAQPMSVLFTAFNDFCKNLLEKDEEHLSQIRTEINFAVGSNVNVLTGLIPNLSALMRVTTPSLFDIGGREALNRFLFYFRLFVRAIASPSHPVVLFLDDLQWADKTLLQLITTLVSDKEVRSLVFVGCYRDNEVGVDHPLVEEVANISVAGVTVTNLKLENINRDSTNALVSDTLHLLPRFSRSLASAVHSKTSGNPLFVVQFLRSLFEEHLLQYSARSRRWEWDAEAIQSKDIAHNVVDLMMRKMLRLEPDVQKLLKECACLGSRFEVSTLNLLTSDRGSNGSIAPILDLVVDEGLMYRKGSSYKFSHDQIQQAAYGLISANEQEALHLHIGRLLWSRATEEELKSIIFIVVDQLHRGSALILDHSEKVKVAGLCLMAGRKATSASAFLPASIYLLQGTALLDEGDWEQHYELSLELFTCCAEAQYVSWNFDGAMITLNPILHHGRSLQDKLRAYYTLLNTLGSRGKQLDAINYGLGVVAQLGESFPDEVYLADVVEDYAKTKAASEGTNDILQMDVMRDTEMIGIMRILSILAPYAYEVNQELMALIISRKVQLSLRCGVVPESAFAFASFGAVACAFGDLRQGCGYGKLALNLLDRFKAKGQLPRVQIVVYGMLMPFSMPMKAVVPSLKHGYELGMSLGDIDFALYNANGFISTSLRCGSKLKTLAEEARAFTQQMKEHKHFMLALILPCYQAILNLMDCSGDPTVLSGDAMNQEEMLNSAVEKQHLKAAYTIYFFRMWLAYLFRTYDVAADMAKRCQEICQSLPVRLETIVNETFYTGLIAAATARGGVQGEWRKVALDAAEKMMIWAANSSWNFQHKVDLLNAEIAYLNGDLDGAAKAYDDAIRLAGEHGFVHEQALACERAGLFHCEAVNAEVGIGYFQQSHKQYVEWGAKMKADDVLSRLT